MGFRFQKRLRVMPGVTLNIGKKGVSTSFGVKGAKITVGKNGVRKTVGLPGTGLSYTEYKKDEQSGGMPSTGTSIGIVVFYAVISIILFWVVYSVVSRLQ